MIGKIFPQEVFELQESGQKVQLIDVRTREEVEVIRAPGILHIPLDVISAQRLREAQIQPSEPVYIICRSGVRSLRACEILARDGFTKLYNVEGGTIAWVEAGLPHELK